MVVADGQQSTRENRLTSWADGLASTVEAQRHELRRSRMELVAAQEVPAAAIDLARTQDPPLSLCAGQHWTCHDIMSGRFQAT